MAASLGDHAGAVAFLHPQQLPISGGPEGHGDQPEPRSAGRGVTTVLDGQLLQDGRDVAGDCARADGERRRDLPSADHSATLGAAVERSGSGGWRAREHRRAALPRNA